MMLHSLYPFVWQTDSGLFRGSLTWEYTLSLVFTLLLALGFVVLLYLQWRDLRQRVSRRVRWGLCLMRGVVYLCLLGMLLNPTLLIQKVLRLLPPLAVVVDTSGSMALPEATGTSRLQQALTYLRSDQTPPLQALSERYQ